MHITNHLSFLAESAAMFLIISPENWLSLFQIKISRGIIKISQWDSFEQNLSSFFFLFPLPDYVASVNVVILQVLAVGIWWSQIEKTKVRISLFQYWSIPEICHFLEISQLKSSFSQLYINLLKYQSIRGTVACKSIKPRLFSVMSWIVLILILISDSCSFFFASHLGTVSRVWATIGISLTFKFLRFFNFQAKFRYLLIY